MKSFGIYKFKYIFWSIFGSILASSEQHWTRSKSYNVRFLGGSLPCTNHPWFFEKWAENARRATYPCIYSILSMFTQPWGPGLDHIFIQLGHAPPTPPSLHGLLVYTCVGTLPHWEPMWQYPIKITTIQVDITFIILKLIDEVLSHAKGS